MRKVKVTIIIMILILSMALLVAGCGARQGSQYEEDITVAGDDVQAGEEQETEDPQIEGEESEQPPVDETEDEAEDETQQPESTDTPTADTTVWPGELNDDPNAPPKGDDHSVRGIPEVIETRVADDGDLLVLVNKYYTVSMDYEPTDLVTIDNKYGTYTDMEMKDVAYEAYKKLYDDAKAEGFDLKLCSTMRSYNTQKTLFNNSLNNRGRETTNVRSAYPGRSEHHTGLAIDVTSASMGWGLTQDFIDYADGQWINDHCHEYGFIVRYPKGKTDITGYAYEPWHLRYVGIDVATYIMANDLTLEEYLGKVPPQE